MIFVPPYSSCKVRGYSQLLLCEAPNPNIDRSFEAKAIRKSFLIIQKIAVFLHMETARIELKEMGQATPISVESTQ